MNTVEEPARVVRFGVFKVDLRAGELRKNGRRIRLQDQPFRILALLVEHPGEVVSREEIREKLWPADTFVEFEHSLNTAVNRLRGALGDSANEPRYIETVPRRGYRFVGQIQNAEAEAEAQELTPAAVSNRRVPIWFFAAVATALLICGGLIATYWLGASSENTDPPLRKFTIPTERSNIQFAAISPNGEHIAYFAAPAPQQTAGAGAGLWVHNLGQGKPRSLGNQFGRNVFWSPESDFVGSSWGASRVEKVPISGGPPITIFEVDGRIAGGAWSADGNSLFVAAGRLFELPGQGGEPEILSAAGDAFFYPAILPGGRKLLVTSATEGEREILALDLKNGRRAVVAKGERGVWSPSGHVVYESRGDIWATAFSPTNLECTGEPFVVQQGATQPSVSLDGTLVFLVQQEGLHQLVWRDRSGREVGEIGQPQGRILMPALSPDEQSVAVLAGIENGDWEIWIHEVSRGQKRRLTFEPSRTDRPAWTPEGDRVTYTSFRREDPDIYIKPADGSGKPELLIGNGFGYGWSPDERHFVFELFPPLGRGADILFLRQTGEGNGYETVPFVTDEFDTVGAQLSPDGRLLAYASDETGEREVYVQPFPEGGTRWMVSAGGGRSPRWRRDGKELFYRAPPEGTTLMAVPVTTEPTFSLGTAERLFEDSGLAGRSHTFDVSSDGQRFVVVKTLQERPWGEIHVVQNWYAEFREREEGAQ